MKRKERLNWYKEEFEKISKEILEYPYLSHYDFLRIRNFKLQNSTIENDSRVELVTKEAFNLAKEDKIREAINKLTQLNGVAIPIASTILAMKFPNKFAIIDKRVIKALRKEEWLKDYLKNPKTYEEYILFMRKTKPLDISLRDFERSLFEK